MTAVLTNKIQSVASIRLPEFVTRARWLGLDITCPRGVGHGMSKGKSGYRSA